MIVHPVPTVWDDVRDDIKQVYVELAKLFPDAEGVWMTGSRTTGRWRDADDPRCRCNGGSVDKRCPSDWDLDIEGLELSEIRARLKVWNESHGPELYADHPCYKPHRIRIPDELWKGI